MNPKPETRSKSASTKDLKIWRERGIDDAWFQRQAQTTWWSVLGGITVGILVTKLSPVLDALKTADWYVALYFLGTILVLTYSWVQISWGSLVMRTPISIAFSLYVMVSNISIAFAANNIDNPPFFLAAMTVASAVSFITQYYFSRKGFWDIFPPDKLKRYKSSLYAYAVQVVVVLLMTIHLFLVPTRLNFIIYGFVTVLVSIALLYWQHKGMQAEKREMGIP